MWIYSRSNQWETGSDLLYTYWLSQTTSSFWIFENIKCLKILKEILCIYYSKMDRYSMKNQLRDGMANCRMCNVKRNRVSNNIELPDCIVEMLCSFLRCKRCAKTIELMTNEPQDLHEYQVKTCYFVNISPFSSKKRINETMKHMGMDVFHQLLDMDEEIPPVPKQSNKYKNYKQTYQNLNTGQRIKPHTHKIKNAVFVDTSSTAQGGGGSFKNRKPIGEVGCCESGMAKRIHWWTERCLRFPLCLSLSLTIYLPTSLSSMYLSIYRSIYLSLSLFLSFI